MKKKLTLSELNVHSFVTSEAMTIKGGATELCGLQSQPQICGLSHELTCDRPVGTGSHPTHCAPCPFTNPLECPTALCQ